MNYWYNYYSTLSCRLLKYIADEKKSSLYYSKLANLAPTPQGQKILLELAADEAEHAANFSRVYRQITGVAPALPPLSPQEIPTYSQGVTKKILTESDDLVKYGKEFLLAPDMYLRSLFYHTQTNKAQHGIRLPLLLAQPSPEGQPEEE